jgi:hypothetical protein
MPAIISAIAGMARSYGRKNDQALIAETMVGLQK